MFRLTLTNGPLEKWNACVLSRESIKVNLKSVYVSFKANLRRTAIFQTRYSHVHRIASENDDMLIIDLDVRSLLEFATISTALVAVCSDRNKRNSLVLTSASPLHFQPASTKHFDRFIPYGWLRRCSCHRVVKLISVHFFSFCRALIYNFSLCALPPPTLLGGTGTTRLIIIHPLFVVTKSIALVRLVFSITTYKQKCDSVVEFCDHVFVMF